MMITVEGPNHVDMVALVKRSNSTDPEQAAQAKSELETVTAQFKTQARSGVETR